MTQTEKLLAGEEEEESMMRLFDIVPRRRRSNLGHERYSPDLSKVPRRKRTVYKYTSITPKWLLRVLSDMKIVDDPKPIVKKTLDLNDVDPKQNCLSIPFVSLNRNDFLTFDESKLLGDDDGKMGVAAFLVDQETKQWQVGLKRLVQRNDSTGTRVESYLLTGEWSDIVKANGLRDDDNITLWSFRNHGVLFFALDFAGDSIDFSEQQKHY